MALVGALASTGSAAAQPASLQQTLEYARDHAPRAAAHQALRDLARARGAESGSLLAAAPSVAGEWTRREDVTGEVTHDRTFEAMLPLEIFGQGIFRRRAARAQREADLAAVDADAGSWAVDIAWMYHERLRQAWLHARGTQQAMLAQQLAEVVQGRVEAGDASQLELELAQIQAGEIARRTLASERALRRVEGALAAAIGWPDSMGLPAADTLALVPIFPDTTGIATQAMALQPQLRAARAARAAGHERARLANAGLFPTAELGMVWGTDDGDDVSGIRASLSVPVLGPPLPERGVHDAELRRLEAELDAAERATRATLASTLLGVGLAAREVELYQRSILPAIDGVRRRTREAYELGELDLSEVLLAEQQARESERGFAEALGSYLDALRELELGSGVALLSGPGNPTPQ
jgi:cobalt-zinc-cadmium efflux system outer membrane protein